MPFKSSARGAYGPQGQKVIKGPLAPVWTTFSPTTPGTSAYSYQFVAIDDSGDAPLYSLASGSVPTGLSLSTSGLLSGTASASGTFTFNVRATDINGRFSDSGNITLTVSLVLYTFTDATFNTNIGSGGNSQHVGISLSAFRSSMTGTPSPSNYNTSYVTAHSQSGIFLWTVPATGNYRIRAVGAGGQNGSSTGGNSASIQGDFSLTQGQQLRLLVGHTGGKQGDYAGGGGGSFVYNHTTSTHLISAGGGGGGDSSAGSGGAGSTSPTTLGNSGGSASSYNGGGGCGGNGTGGAGFSGNGGTGSGGGISYSFLNGGQGATDNPGDCVTNAVGGFGGGGAGGNGPGGAGGHFGGNAAGNDSAPAAGGGGSYNAGSNQVNQSGVGQNSNGFIVITKI
jgi:hypothetical protein